jgi:serine phosphatase RsbU (regulator of sigma subunit)
MRELGGDFVHMHVSAEGIVHVALIDVTGHGLAAALTVNRLYGELERIRAESARARPGEVLTLLNRYVNLTMSRHNIYATALCVMLDPYAGELAWASAGHPPGYVRGASGGVTDLLSTTLVLGAFEPEIFKADERETTISVGDTVVLFTDGTFEARDRTGQMFGLDRMRELMTMRQPPRRWPSFIEAAIGKHGTGVPEDDMLIAALTYRASRAGGAPEPERATATASP